MLRLFLIAITIIALALAGWIFLQKNTEHTNQKTITQSSFGGTFILVDHDGKTITESSFREHPSILFFGLTHCPEICPARLSEIESWFEALGDYAKDVQAYFITVDPERDTPKVLHDYLTNISDRIIGISGDPEKVHKMIKDFKIFTKKVETQHGDYTVDHTASILLLDRQGYLVGTIAHGENKDVALTKLKNLIARN